MKNITVPIFLFYSFNFYIHIYIVRSSIKKNGRQFEKEREREIYQNMNNLLLQY